MNFVILEPTKLMPIGTRTTYQATRDAAMLRDLGRKNLRILKAGWPAFAWDKIPGWYRIKEYQVLRISFFRTPLSVQ